MPAAAMFHILCTDNPSYLDSFLLKHHLKWKDPPNPWLMSNFSYFANRDPEREQVNRNQWVCPHASFRTAKGRIWPPEEHTEDPGAAMGCPTPGQPAPFCTKQGGTAERCLSGSHRTQVPTRKPHRRGK